MKKIDIIVPVLNESKNLKSLFYRIDKSLSKFKINYRIIIVDDNSTDDTFSVVKNSSKKYPILFNYKKGKSGKAYSILEGIKYSDSEYVAMIDGDLQYPPESIPEMLEKAINEDLGVVVANRAEHKEGMLRRLGSKVVRFVASKFMGINLDFQSGLKIFKREIGSHVHKKDVKSWTFDLPLLHTAFELGEKIGSVDIAFAPRLKGESKFNFLSSVMGVVDVLLTLVKLKFKSRKIFYLEPNNKKSMIGAGIIYKRKKFLTHTTLNHSNSAIVTFTRFQKLFVLTLFVLFFSFLFFNTKSTLIGFVAVLSTIYFADVFFNLYLVLKSLHFPPELHFDGEEVEGMLDKDLPKYTILCPMYREAGILHKFIESIDRLDYPKNKLEVLLLLEEDDHETIAKAKELNLKSYYKILVVPHSYPKTKPKACNYGLAHATGEFVVIYDAEDIPDPDQLKKAVLGFRNLGVSYSCLQAKLNYHNPNQNWLTRLFTTEYSLWFDVMLPALQTVNTFIPLGGTSNHFRRAELNKFEGWDPFNVTEDADLGVRLFRAGGKTAIIDSMTYEEANSNLKNWIRQRSRWIKGYLQTYLVHMRNPLELAKKFKGHFIIFQLVAGLRMTFMIINPILWLMTLSYFVLYKFVGPQIESLYPASIFYMAITSAVFGNFLYVFYYMVGTAKHGQYQLIKYVFLVPVYWFFTSIAAGMAFWQLLTNPHYWEKTIHGLSKSEKKKLIFKLEFAGLREYGFSSLNKIKNFSKSSLGGGAFLIFASMVANFLNFVYNAYLGRKLSLEDFGLLGMIGSLMYIVQVPLSAISRTITHRSAFLLGKYKKPAKQFWEFYRNKMVKLSVILSIFWIISIPFLMNLFKSYELLPFIVFVPIIMLGFIGSVDKGFLGGNLFFKVEGIASVIEAVIKLTISIFIVEIGFHDFVYLSIPSSIMISFIISWLFIRNTKGLNKKLTNEVLYNFPKPFFVSSIVNKLSTVAFLSADLILVKIFLSPDDAGRYALISLIGKMVYMIGNMFTQFIIPVISKEEGSGVNSTKSFYKLMSLSSVSSIMVFVIVGVFGHITAPLLFGDKALSITQYLPVYSLSIALMTIIGGIVSFNQTKNRHLFAYFGLFMATVQLLSIVVFHFNLSAVVHAMFYSTLFNFVLMLFLHFKYQQLEIISRNIFDAMGIFKNIPSLDDEKYLDKLKILVFNWRDTRHVWSGGAEVYVHEISKRWAQDGHTVTVFCGNDRKSPRNEVIDGVQMVRRGGFYTVYIWAFLYYILRFRGKYDIVIDNENGIPFFTPLYVKEPVIGLVHHVHQEVILKELKLPKYLLPIALIATFIERFIMPLVYKNTQMITVSESSKKDMEKIGLGKILPIKIVNPGVDLKLYNPTEKTKNPSVLYVGRIKKYKSINTLIMAVSKIVDEIPSIELNIAGFGEEQKYLEKLVDKLKLNKNIKFLGRIDESNKIELMGKSWVFVYPSTFEGWGISAIEANACGTPVVASDVSGLRDSVQDNISGYLVPAKDVNSFAQKIRLILEDEGTRINLSSSATMWSSNFDWDKSAQIFLATLVEFRVNQNENKLLPNFETSIG